MKGYLALILNTAQICAWLYGFTSKHETLPGKKQPVLTPFNSDPVPYWIIKEVAL